MTEILISENKIQDYNYKYYLIESSDNKALKYGVKIDKYNEDEQVVDSKCVQHIFKSKEKMIKAIRIVSKLQVTPITLEDIVIDNVYTR